MKWLREPLLLFLALGAGLFVLHSMVGNEDDDNREWRIVVTTRDIERLGEQWEQQWQRPPTQEQLDDLVEQHIREEVLYREALHLDLDRDDTVVRRRMVQKVEFISRDLVDGGEPTEDELQVWYETHPELYSTPVRVSLSHVYFNVDGRGEAAATDAEQLLAELRRDPERESSWQGGDRFQREHEYEVKTQRQLEQLFGAGFAQQVLSLEPDAWHGPVESGYGLHLVRVRARIDPELPGLDAVRTRVVRDLSDDRQRRADAAFYHALRRQYDIEIEQPEIGGRMTREDAAAETVP